MAEFLEALLVSAGAAEIMPVAAVALVVSLVLGCLIVRKGGGSKK